VAGWPTLTLLMSDSLKATVIVIVLVLTISANGDAEAPEAEEDEELAPPRLPALVPPPPLGDELEDDPLLDVVDFEALDVDPAETESPGAREATDTIVPLIGE
jgi:hypothetical protein